MSASGILSVNPTARQRRWWAALAIFALAFLSLRPACDVWLSHWSNHEAAHVGVAGIADAHVHAPAHAPSEPLCCTSIENSSLVKPFDAIAWRSGPSDSAVAFSVPRTVVRAVVPLFLSLTASVIPPGSPPYYARSARILR